ncbi:MAG: hypothetical protein ABR56_07585 [Acidimicrobium sp. BACL27 MAG-120823-bin4]|nr:MAG: hypothetical protein ABR56_07585 [Acidimicrobium sp. BACL27 MAG-120823-bin4]
MPTYVYKFIDSGETIEIYQAFSDDALTQAPHPSDGKPRPVKKVFTPVGITFKGGGFYKTDSATSGKTAASGTSASTALAQLAARLRVQPATRQLARRVSRRVRAAQIRVRAQARHLRRPPQKPKLNRRRLSNAARGCRRQIGAG